MQTEFFTPQSIGTLYGASFAVFLIANTSQSVFNFNPKWLGLLLSFIISFIIVYISNKPPSYYLLGILNSFLIYSNSVGIVQITGKNEDYSNSTSSRGPYGSSDVILNRRSFRTKWF